jgi:hypothetical protein
VATPALATDSGFYLGLSVGQSQYDVPNEPTGIFLTSNGTRLNDSDTAFSLSFGYRLNPYLGFELALSDLGDFELSEEGFGSVSPPATTAVGAAVTVDGGARGTSLAVVGTLPLQNFSLYGKVGAMYTNAHVDKRVATTFGTAFPNNVITSASSTTTEAMYAVGAGYTFDSVVFISLEYQRIPKVGDEAKLSREVDVDVIFAGFQYRF